MSKQTCPEDGAAFWMGTPFCNRFGIRWLAGYAPMRSVIKRVSIITVVSTMLAPVIAGSMELGYIENMLGPWDVKYPAPDGMIREDYVERLVLMRDGNYTWTPAPEWARPEGRWSVTKDRDLNDALVLCFERRAGPLRCHFLVLTTLPNGPTYWNWQRKVAVVVHPDGRKEIAPDVVIFSERILRADRPKR